MLIFAMGLCLVNYKITHSKCWKQCCSESQCVTEVEVKRNTNVYCDKNEMKENEKNEMIEMLGIKGKEKQCQSAQDMECTEL